jgi:hypothetical protein
MHSAVWPLATHPCATDTNSTGPHPLKASAFVQCNEMLPIRPQPPPPSSTPLSWWEQLDLLALKCKASTLPPLHAATHRLSSITIDYHLKPLTGPLSLSNPTQAGAARGLAANAAVLFETQ